MRGCPDTEGGLQAVGRPAADKTDECRTTVAERSAVARPPGASRYCCAAMSTGQSGTRPVAGPSRDTARPLLSLLMIVRDERHALHKTLSSALPYVDRFTILDTGSTDSTPELIGEVSAKFGAVGRVFEEPFVDFAVSRNRCIELAAAEAEFFLTMDANDELRNGDALVAWCRRYRARTEPAYDSFLMRVQWNHEQFCMQRLFRSDAPCEYVGAVHEYLKTREPPVATVEGAYIYHDRQADEAASHARWLRDAALLERELSRDPGNARNLFYLAQTYACIGRYTDAFRYYTARARMGNDDEETWQALYRRAELAERFLDVPWPQVEAMYVQAFRHTPVRAEPLVRIGRHYAAAQDPVKAYRCLRKACDMPVPAGARMTVDLELYEYGRWDLLGSVAWHVGRYDEGREAIRKALRYPRLSESVRRQLMINLAVYDQRA